MKAHFFDIDSILEFDSKVWIVDKDSPNIPLIKISKYDFNLIRSGVYKSQNNLVHFSGHDYWLTDNLLNTLKVKCKNHKADFSNLGFSLQEFMNKELIENLNYEIKLENILHLKNTNDHIYIICSKNSKKNYELVISKIEDKLKSNGLVIENYYFISETFLNRNDDEIAFKKVRLLLQHLLGYKTETDKFSDEKISQYDSVYFYDTDSNSIELSKNVNNILLNLLDKSDDSIKSIIKDFIKQKELILFANLVTHNKVNKFVTTKIQLELNHLIKTFESFKFRF